MKNIDTVVCLHGLYLHGAGMYLVKRRLEAEYGMRALLFSYPSVRGTLDENAAELPAVDQQIVVEAATVQPFGGNSAATNARADQYALGIRYQLPIAAAWIVRADAMYGFIGDNNDDIAGARLELRRKF